MYAIKLLWGGATLNPDTSRGGSALVSESTVVVSRPPILHHLMSGLMAGGSRSFACRLGAPLQYHHIQRHGFSTEERFAEGVPARSARRTARLPHQGAALFLGRAGARDLTKRLGSDHVAP
jgi:hypothetical protein